MQKRSSRKPAREAEAVIHRVDPVNRELVAVVQGAAMTIYVPPDCGVVLRGERVKLRMVQPGDRLRVAYSELADSLVAHEIEVRPAYPLPWTSH